MDRSPLEKEFHRPRLRRDHVEFSVYLATLISGPAALQVIEALQKTVSTRFPTLTLNASGGSVSGSRGGSISVDPGRVLLTGESVAIGSS